MTWGEFKKKVEEKGVKDETVLDLVDVDPWMNMVTVMFDTPDVVTIL